MDNSLKSDPKTEILLHSAGNLSKKLASKSPRKARMVENSSIKTSTSFCAEMIKVCLTRG